MIEVHHALQSTSRSIWRAVAAVVALALIGPTARAADPIFDASGATVRRPMETQLPFEHVDPLTGNLLLTFTDLALPGNGGLDLVIQRTYNSKAVYYNWALNGNTLGEDTWAGLGWSLHMGRIRWVSGADIQGPMELPDGSQHKFFRHIDGSGKQITRDFWVLDKSATPPTVSLPNGLVYEFGGPIVFLPAGSGPDNSYLYVTKIRDSFGNSITVNYMTGASDPKDGISSIVQDLRGSQTRTVTFTLDGSSRKSVGTMTYGSRTWTYTQAAGQLTGTTRSLLTAVAPPVGPAWGFSYASTSSPSSEKDEISGLTTPNGGTIAYTFRERTFYLGSTVPVRSRTLWTRTTGGRDVSGGTWTYDYATGISKNQTQITFPAACSPTSNGSVLYTFHGVGNFSGTVPVWQVGLLKQKDTESGTTVLESESYADADGWLGSALISNDTEIIGNASEAGIRVPLVDVRRLTRGTKTYTSDNAYHTTNYSDYGQPYQTTETGDTAGFTRTTVRTFDFAFTPYIRDRVVQEDVTVGSETFTSTYAYNHANGFKTSESIYGIGRTFTPYLIGGVATGDVDTVTDAESKATSFTYTWGSLKNTVTPAYTITRTINSDGTLANEYRGTTANQVSYTYDNLMRPLTRVPALGNTFTTTYDNTSGSWVKTTRGTSWTQTNLDGFGRPSSTQTAAGIKTDTNYNACGRATYVGYPYTGTANIGAAYVFDDLGRISKKTNPDSTWVGYTYSNGIDVDVRNERNLTTKLDFAAFGNPDEQRLVKVTDANNGAWTYAYNALGSLTSMTPPVGTARAWEYFPTNLLKRETHPELGTLTPPIESTDSIYYTYYLNGMLKTRQDPQFNTSSALTQFTYDGNNRLTGIDYPAAYNAFDTTIGYDNFDHRTSVADSYVSSAFGYDNGQRLTSRTDTVDLDGPGGAAAKTLSATFFPDGNDNVQEVDYPSGESVSYNFDLDNRVSKAYDTAASTTVYANNVSYHASGGITSYLAGNGLTHTTTYDPSTYRVQTINAGGKLQLEYALYDAVGNLKTLNDLGRTGMNQSFDYDALDRLTTANGPWGAGSFSYYARGDRQTKTVAGTTTTYNYHSSKTTQLTSTSGGEVDSFGYDQNGNMTSGFGSTFTYSPANAVTTSTPTGGAATTYRYDQDALRKVKATGNDVRYYAHGPGGMLLSEMCAVGGTGGLRGVRDYVYVGRRLVAELETDAPYTVDLVAATRSVGEGAATHVTQARLSTSSATTGPVTVRYRTANGTATAGSDYTAVDQVVTFDTGSTNGATRDLAVTILNDQVVEANEDFSIQLSEPSCGAKLGATTIQTVTILDDEPTVSVTIANSSVGEAGGSAPVTVQVVPANGQPLSNTVTVQYATADGTAVAGQDYTAKSGTATFTPASPGPQTVNVPILNDTIDEPDQTFTLSLSGVTGGTLGSPSVQTVTIQDDDPTAVVNLSNSSVTEGNSGTTNLVFTATLDRGSEWNPSVNFATADGTAVAGSDYYTTNGTRSFPAGVTSLDVNVAVVADRVSEGTETFPVGLSAPVNLVVGTGGTGTILDDDGAGLSVEDASTREGLPAQVKIRLTPVATSAVDVDWATVAGTATADVDYVTSSGTAHFGLGQSEAVVPVPTTLDSLVEGVETFTVQLSNPVGSTIASGTGTVKIVDGELGSDFDGDVKTDLVWQETGTAAFQVWVMNGATQTGTDVTNPASAPGFRLAGTGSFQPGGRNDMLLQSVSSTLIYVWLMNGHTAAGVSPTPDNQADAAYTVAGTGDFNLDGKTDILWWHQTNGTLQVWLMNGVVQTSSAGTTPAGVVDLNWQVAGTGDFNQDGKADILWRNATSGKFVVWLMDGLTRTSGTFLVPEMLSDLNWRVKSSRDLDGDGETDLVWQHQLSHKVVVWFMDGIYRRGGTYTTPDGSGMGPTWWVAGPR